MNRTTRNLLYLANHLLIAVIVLLESVPKARRAALSQHINTLDCLLKTLRTYKNKLT